MHSMPISSDSRARRTLSSNVFCHRSGTFVAARPLEQFEPKTASLNRLPPAMVGLRWVIMTDAILRNRASLRSMRAFLARRLLHAVFVIWGVVTVVFFLVRL